jgi:hypothetical protein
MMKHAIWSVSLFGAVAVAGCDQGVKAEATSKAKATVTLTSVAFADNCGGTPPNAPPKPASPPMRAAPKPAESPAAPSVVAHSQERVADSAVQYRCEQTAMQLAVTGEPGTELHIKSVEVFDGSKSLGTLEVSKPTRWDEAKAAYETWDEKVLAGPMSVSYVLSQPAFVDMYAERDRTYTVKVVAAVGDVDQPLKTTVLVVARPAPVPT